MFFDLLAIFFLKIVWIRSGLPNFKRDKLLVPFLCAPINMHSRLTDERLHDNNVTVGSRWKLATITGEVHCRTLPDRDYS